MCAVMFMFVIIASPRLLTLHDDSTLSASHPPGKLMLISLHVS